MNSSEILGYELIIEVAINMKSSGILGYELNIEVTIK